MQVKDASSQWIALVIVESAVMLSMFAFIAGRNDVSTRQATLLGITAVVNNLIGLGAGMLVGGVKIGSSQSNGATQKDSENPTLPAE